MARGLKALSAGYVEKRNDGGVDRALDGRGKRAAFSLYYGALHFSVTVGLLKRLEAGFLGSGALLDLGCGTGVCGAAWSLHSRHEGSMVGVDRSAFARHETEWTYRSLGLRGETASSILETLAAYPKPAGVILGFALNEFDETLRSAILEPLMARVARGARLLVIEPISKRVAPWWPEWTAPFVAQGARMIETRLSPALSKNVVLLGRSAGLRPDSVAVRALCSW